LKTSSKIRLGVVFIYLILGAYIASAMISIAGVRVHMKNYLDPRDVGIESSGIVGNIIIINANITVYFNFSNPGIYAISADIFHAKIFIENSENNTALPNNSLIGEINTSFYFPARQTTNESMTVEIYSEFFEPLALYVADFRVELTIIHGGLAGIYFDLNTSIIYHWNVTQFLLGP
jgi:hypothetical protein